jgi:electron transport complex protein RnfD
MTENTFLLESSPHLRDQDSVPKIMYAVILSLIPAVLASVYFFRWRALLIYACCVAGGLATEALFLWLRKKPMSSLWDGSVIITALLLAMTLPPSISVDIAIIGVVVAVSLGKHVFGGLGNNIFNPALVGRAFISTAFPVAMTTWTPPKILTVDAATFATPLGNLKFQDALSLDTLTPIKDLFWGNIGGCMGETSAIALLIGAVFLFYKRAIDWRIPFGIFASLSVFTGIFWLAAPDRYASPLFHVFAGGLIIGAFFMATDMVTSPITPRGTWIYALGIGLLVGLIRLFGGLPEGVMFSILFMNMFVPLLNRFTRPRILGKRRIT